MPEKDFTKSQLTVYQIINCTHMGLATCVNPTDQNLVFYGYANQSINIGFTVSMTCASGYDWNNGVSGNTPMLANYTVSNGQAVWTTVWPCTSTNDLTQLFYNLAKTVQSTLT